MTLVWTTGRLEGLRPADLYDCLALRSAVFVVEQHCVYLDPDGADHHSTHLLGRDAAGALCAYLRIVDPGVKYPEPSLGRVLTSPAVRGAGLGRALLAQGLHHCLQQWPGRGIRISAQAHLERFYAAFGFEAVGSAYLEDDIPHIEMLRAASSAALP